MICDLQGHAANCFHLSILRQSLADQIWVCTKSRRESLYMNLKIPNLMRIKV